MSDTNSITHVFDQTNGVIEGLEGESDGTAGSDLESAADRDPDAAAPADREPADVSAPDETSTGGDFSPAVAATGENTAAPTPAVDADLSESSASADPFVDTATEPIDAEPAAADPAANDSIGHVFDQTNGVADGLEGDSDGTATGDEASAADRGGLNEPNPVGQQDAFHDDHYGAEDGRDRNP